MVRGQHRAGRARGYYDRSTELSTSSCGLVGDLGQLLVWSFSSVQFLGTSSLPTPFPDLRGEATLEGRRGRLHGGEKEAVLPG